VLNIIVPVFDLGRSFRKVKSGKNLEMVLKKSGNLYSKFPKIPGIAIAQFLSQQRVSRCRFYWR